MEGMFIIQWDQKVKNVYISIFINFSASFLIECRWHLMEEKNEKRENFQVLHFKALKLLKTLHCFII